MKKIALLLIACAGAAHADGGAPRKLTFEDAIAIATSKSPDVAIAGENAAIADDKIADTKSKRYPSLKADGGAERWN
ncbi:MAG TPA: hypothetical protein VL463_16410, partial [Kofleriaceae bacterium]|nr:hypothetical protein [Kofleriaceae bacterium]